MKKLVLTIVAAAGLWLLAPSESAQAQTEFVGYVCRVTVGSGGSTTYRLHQGVNCTGEDRGTFYIHGDVTAAGADRMHDMLVAAASTGMRITVQYTTFAGLVKYITNLQLHAN